MAISLSYIDIDSINQTIQNEHESWIKKNAPLYLDFTKITNQQYSILNYPELWSGARLFETKIEKKGKDSPASEHVAELIKKAQKEYKNDPLKIKEINDFEKKYTKYLALLKERCLLRAIAQTLYEISRSKKQEEQLLEEIKKDFQKILNISALLNIQTRQDCLKAHKQITMLAYALKSKADEDQQKKITQLEVLSKRLLDCHYEGAKKLTIHEAIANDLSTITSFIGLGVGVPAAIFAIIGIFVPPLLPIAGILGTIGFISYTASAISAAKMANEAISYGRGPSPSDVKWMVFDIVLAPFYIVGGQIFSGLTHTLKNLKPLHTLVKTTGNIWNNIVSNVFPDIFFVKDIGSEMISVGSVYTATGELKNTLSATSWKKMRSALAAHDHEILDKINRAKEEISLLNQNTTALNGRDFAYTKININNKPGEKPLIVTKSFHAHILLWENGFIGTTTSKEAQKIKDAVDAYKNLSPDTMTTLRVESLCTIQEHCNVYLTKYKGEQSKGRYNFVQNLATNIEKELNNLCVFITANKENSNDATPVLVGFKAPG
ncbi:hypothetical protein Lsan_4189 [Legionella santicrucis]|uniref:Uncharacterized protein n=1 Tax=Legionella santicrucis TaxID=45074 RepID=A0A0W0YB32_9GAMM|nr:hypothetical protein [Legionella santicrucis]KTD53779.1 hypothetical protein Lsan_4189 [Legionella santicrucis]